MHASHGMESMHACVFPGRARTVNVFLFFLACMGHPLSCVCMCVYVHVHVSMYLFICINACMFLVCVCVCVHVRAM